MKTAVLQDNENMKSKNSMMRKQGETMLIQKMRNYLYKKASLYRKLSIFYYLYFYPLPYKILYLKKAHGKTVFFYPSRPHPMEILYKVFHLSGYRITDNPNVKADIVVNYEDTTVRTRNDIAKYLKGNQYVINRYCTDIRKEKVEVMFRRVFGYGLKINPQTHKGNYIKKSNLNAMHDGVVLTVPKKPQRGYVYQKVVNNQIKDTVLDFRAPFIIGTIPFVYLKYRPVETRFSNTNRYAKITNTKNVFSQNEIEKIRKFCKLMGLDYGELDILRDNDDKRIYIVDVNNTPSGPPNHIQKGDYWKALTIITDTLLDRISENKQ